MNTFIALVSLLLACASTDRRPTIGGQVVDPRNTPVPDAEVRLAGQRVMTTGTDGRFVLRTAPSLRFAVSVSAPGFMATTKVLTRATDGNTIVLWPRSATKPLRVAAGGRLEFPGGAISFAPNTLVNARGTPATGDVDVAFSTFDIQDSRQLRGVPGDFTARMRDGALRQLETYGVFEVYVTDAEGQRLNLIRGATATVELPRLGRPTRDPGLYRFDEVDGRWVEVGTFTPGAAISFAELPDLLTAWNADDPLNTACIQVQVLGCRGCEGSPQPAAAVDVVAEGVDYAGTSYGVEEPSGSGFYCLSVKSGALTSVVVTDPLTGLSGNAMEIATPSVLANATDCADSTKCPLVAATHTVGVSFSDALTAPDLTDARWCPSDGWSNGAPSDTFWDKTKITFGGAGMQLSLSQCSGCSGKTYSSGEYRTKCFHGYGTYEVTMSPALVPGMVTGFFTYTDSLAATGDGTIGENGTNGHDEIDVEILGDSPAHPCPSQIAVQSNWIGKGIGVNRHEQVDCIPSGTHVYGFTWSATKIEWYYRSGSQTTVLRTEQRGVGPWALDPWPTQPGRVIMNLWAVDKNDPNATGWAGDPTGVTNATATFKDVVVP